MEDSLIDNESTRTQVQHDLTEAQALDGLMSALKLFRLFWNYLNSNQRNEIRIGEIPSANFHGNARGLAKLASILANKGKGPDGRQLLSNETWEKMHAKATLALDMNLGKYQKLW